ncbi:MAG: 3-phosphoshikimate 1-carboxyvinyltransferase [Thermoplasmata archaeon]|nr:3-phosphoshikimate 1-carboxyvinyltransferase [Thermoplasmata archaeon]
MIVTVSPGVARGRLEAPPSKSYTHRALIAGFFAGRPYRVLHPLVSDDTRATRRGLQQLGTRIHTVRGAWSLRPPHGSPSLRRVRLDCGESGTTLRFLASVAATTGRPVQFVGRPQLAGRPLEGLVQSLEKAGVTVGRPSGGSLPLDLRGPLRPGHLAVPGGTSSQYVSSLLLALPTLDGPSSLEVLGRRVSEPYIRATLAVMAAHGVRVQERSNGWRIPAPQSYQGNRFDVPGDASSAAYLWTAAAVTGGQVTVDRIPSRWPQADRLILDVLRDAGASVRESERSVEVRGPVGRTFSVDLTSAPDLYPLAGVLASVTPGISTIRGAAHVVFKESNRRAATIDLVRRIGGRCTSGRDRLTIHGTDHPRALRLRGLDDHRLVMSAAVAATVARGASSIGDGLAVRKSFPGFWSAWRRIGINVEGDR